MEAEAQLKIRKGSFKHNSQTAIIITALFTTTQVVTYGKIKHDNNSGTKDPRDLSADAGARQFRFAWPEIKSPGKQIKEGPPRKPLPSKPVIPSVDELGGPQCRGDRRSGVSLDRRHQYLLNTCLIQSSCRIQPYQTQLSESAPVRCRGQISTLNHMSARLFNRLQRVSAARAHRYLVFFSRRGQICFCNLCSAKKK